MSTTLGGYINKWQVNKYQHTSSWFHPHLDKTMSLLAYYNKLSLSSWFNKNI
jgi:hypothetical protein